MKNGIPMKSSAGQLPEGAPRLPCHGPTLPLWLRLLPPPRIRVAHQPKGRAIPEVAGVLRWRDVAVPPRADAGRPLSNLKTGGGGTHRGPSKSNKKQKKCLSQFLQGKLFIMNWICVC